jgi:hypothetical protein
VIGLLPSSPFFFDLLLLFLLKLLGIRGKKGRFQKVAKQV